MNIGSENETDDLLSGPQLDWLDECGDGQLDILVCVVSIADDLGELRTSEEGVSTGE